MNFKSMEYFITVAAKKNITNAAEELYITQQTLSSHISAIENELDCQLIIRSKPLELTYAGEIFLKHALSIYEKYQSMWNEFNDLTNNQRGKILIGINFAKSHTIMPRITAAFKSLYPNIEVRINEYFDKYLLENLVSKNIDLAIGNFKEKNTKKMNISDFYNEEIIMLVPTKLHSEKSLNGDTYLDDLSEFSNLPFVLSNSNDFSGEISRKIIDKSGFKPIVNAQSRNIETLIDLCVKGIGICFCPKSLAQSLITPKQSKCIKIYHFNSETTYQIRFAYRKESYQWKIITEFIRIALETKNYI